jgi:DNA-directed RNA polymerase specialized sigma24 family protein
MSFPQTRLTLIQRLVVEGNEEDWRTFVRDYWGPVCRFAMRWGAANLDDAEDVAIEAFEIVWRNDLLERWVAHRSAKLRTLLCAVLRNILANRGRVRATRQKIIAELSAGLDHPPAPPGEGDDLFYGAWVEDLLERAVGSLAADYGKEGKGDYLRVLYGRICEERTIAECATALNLTPASVDNYFRHARARLSDKLRELLSQQISRYVPADEIEQELESEWRQLGSYLAEHGGLEAAVHRAHVELDRSALVTRRERAITRLSGRHPAP